MSTVCLDPSVREVERPADDDGWRTVDPAPSKLVKAAREQEDQEDWDFWLNAWGED